MTLSHERENDFNTTATTLFLHFESEIHLDQQKIDYLFRLFILLLLSYWLKMLCRSLSKTYTPWILKVETAEEYIVPNSGMVKANIEKSILHPIQHTHRQILHISNAILRILVWFDRCLAKSNHFISSTLKHSRIAAKYTHTNAINLENQHLLRLTCIFIAVYAMSLFSLDFNCFW